MYGYIDIYRDISVSLCIYKIEAGSEQKKMDSGISKVLRK